MKKTEIENFVGLSPYNLSYVNPHDTYFSVSSFLKKIVKKLSAVRCSGI
jgi:hypothetical protein